MEEPQAGDIWEYTYHTVPSHGGVVTVHFLVLEESSLGKNIHVCRFFESGWVTEVSIKDSDRMKFRKLA